ncbi:MULTISPECIES: CBS domain-containing protein [Sanguibacteroides]|uniref:Uncharacterized protein n=1 Tax=Sanguibacteroides justesenii TaxID=1547597 RepID=A0A0C3R5I5_9PORP|nr:MULTISPECIES: CBS domain-containing protein [Sanguibacteroides]KIO43224.1 hypothetical protein IE90_13550 [Sanguibacteroides justesenii]KIO44940.1 hypothetical protein BA92_07950 [Sanguibacteroides justesenii]PXZ43160.1 CBS domain-containing protein [Sanguibacteroides justesenii]
MIALKILSQVIPVLNREDRCSQALGWMEIFRVSHLPVVEGDEYLGLLEDETIYAHGNLEDPIASLEIHRESTFVYEDTYIYDIVGVASAGMLSVIPVLSRSGKYRGVILPADILYQVDRLLGANLPGGIIVLEVNNIDYSLAEIAQIVEYNEAKVVSCCVTGGGDTNKVYVVLKVNTSNLEPILETFNRYQYSIKITFVNGEEYGEELRERYGQLMRYMEM